MAYRRVLIIDEEATRDIPVILLTGKAKPSQDDIFDSLGVQGIIKKPFDPRAFSFSQNSIKLLPV